MKNYKPLSIVIFAFLFVATVSFAAIYLAKGYNPINNEVSGILEIASNPSGAKVTIDNEKVAGTPYKIELSAGKHNVKIEKDKYVTWEKKINVEPSIVKEIEANLILFEKEGVQLTFLNPQKVFFDPLGEFALLLVNNKKENNGLWKINYERPILNPSSTAQRLLKLKKLPANCFSNDKYHMSISKDKNRALLKCSSKKDSDYHVINIQNINEGIININKKTSLKPEKVYFRTNSENLLVKTKNNLYNYNVSTGDKEKLLNGNISDLTIIPYSDNFVIRKSRNSEDLILLKDSTDKTIFDLPNSIASKDINQLWGNQNSDQFLIFINHKKAYFYKTSSQEYQPFAPDDIKLISWSPNGKAILYKQNSQLKVASIVEYPDHTFKIKTATISKDYNQRKISIKWSPKSNQLISHNVASHKTYISDIDGENKVLTSERKLKVNDGYTVSTNGTHCIIFTYDANNKTNLFSIKLRE